MTSMLDLFDSYLERLGHKTVRIDGSMAWQDRQVRHPCPLIALKPKLVTSLLMLLDMGRSFSEGRYAVDILWGCLPVIAGLMRP